MRNMNTYSEKGRSRLIGKSSRYDLSIGELVALIKDTNNSIEKTYTAITTAYYAGLESGYRLREKEESSN